MLNVRIKTKNKNSTESFLRNVLKRPSERILKKYGELGVSALSKATPIDSGKTANSWYYVIVENKNTTKLEFHNSNSEYGVPVAILIQYGHGTQNGGFVQGRDYINPAIQPIFDKLSNDIWKEVRKV